MNSTVKKRLRKQLKSERDLMAPAEIKTRSHKLNELLTTLLLSQPPCTVAIYYPMAGEVDLLSLLENQNLRKFEWALPVCVGQGQEAFLQFAQFTSGDSLEEGQYGIPVPKNPHWVEPQVVIVPCLGASRLGFRLGYGAGWYDRTFNKESFNALAIGAVWDEALVDESFHEPHDAPLDYVVTTSEVIKF